jgi:hypothetical protein
MRNDLALMVRRCEQSFVVKNRQNIKHSKTVNDGKRPAPMMPTVFFKANGST